MLSADFIDVIPLNAANSAVAQDPSASELQSQLLLTVMNFQDSKPQSETGTGLASVPSLLRILRM